MFNNMYRGIVKEHSIDGDGRCRVFVPSVMPQLYELSSNKLPWCEPAQPLFAGSTNGGVFQYPYIGSTVWVFFVDGDINYPVMFACTLGSKNNFSTDKYIIKTESTTIEIDDIESKLNIIVNSEESSMNPQLNITVTGEESSVNITSDKTVNITTNEVNITAPTNNILGDVNIDGDTTITGDTTTVGDVSDSNATTPTMAEMRTMFNSHTHPYMDAYPVGPGVTTAPNTQM